jgi:hypothetical protein
MENEIFIKRIKDLACEYWKYDEMESAEYTQKIRNIITDIRADTHCIPIKRRSS